MIKQFQLIEKHLSDGDTKLLYHGWDEKAFLNLKDTVYVSGLGGDKLRDGSYDYYISEPKQINNLLGIGAFLMASVEFEKVMSSPLSFQ